MIDPRAEDSDFVAGVRAAAEALRPLFEPTPLQRNDFLSARHDGDVWLKREDLSPVRSYKIRGAINAMGKVLAGAGRGRRASSVPPPATTRRAWPSPAGTSASRASSSCR